MFLKTISRLSGRGTVDVNKSTTKLEQDFDIGESLGRGGYGQIIKAKRKCDNNEFAIKIIKFDSNLKDVATIRQEANLLSKLSHNNIVRYFNSWIEAAKIPIDEYEKFKSDSEEESLYSEIQKLSRIGCISSNSDNDDEFEEGNSLSFDDSCDILFEEQRPDENEHRLGIFEPNFKELNYLIIQMELCEKRTLRTAIDSNLYLEDKKLSKYLKEICQGLSYIHKDNIVHRDLKPENIFLTSEDVIKIGDFGLSKQICLENEFEAMQNDKLPYGSLTASCGTPVYIAPELHKRNKFNVKADIYSLGVTYFEMCSKPMTNMEKSRTFPVTLQRWKSINFPSKNYEKKTLLKSLLHVEHHIRPTCDEILKILNSKSTDEIKDAMQQSRRVSNQEWKTFERTLKMTNIEQAELINSFTKAAVKIFELHGGKNLPMPTFIPSFEDHYNDLTTIFIRNGIFSSISNTSRIAFSYYVATQGITNLRRYSVGKVFEEGYHSPNEIQECLFEIVSPAKNDFIVDAETLYIAEKVCGNLLQSGKKEILFLVNHGLIFSTILKHCKISKKNTALFIDSTMDKAGLQILLEFELEKHIQLFLQIMSKFYDVTNLEKIVQSFIETNKNNEMFSTIEVNIVKKALNQPKIIIDNARKFGLKSRIVVSPLLVNQKHYSNFMFRVLLCDVNCCDNVASGGRFESLIKICNRTRKKKKPFEVTAADVSFNVEKIISCGQKLSRHVDVCICAKEKVAAIPLYTYLLSKEIKCKLLNEWVHFPEQKSKHRLIMIYVCSDYSCTAFEVRGTSNHGCFIGIYDGKWEEEKFYKKLLSVIDNVQWPEQTQLSIMQP